jgi:hypothetical protein
MERTWTWGAVLALALAGTQAWAQVAPDSTAVDTVATTAASAGARGIVPAAVAAGTAATIAAPAAVPAAIAAEDEGRAEYRLRDYSGPRLGFLFAAGGPEMRQEFKDRGFGSMMSLFGWTFERTVVPVEGGPLFVTDATPLLGGFEYGKILPSLTLTAGLRTRRGWEFGMGPSFTPVNSKGKASVGLVIAAGKAIEYSGLSLPVNLGVSTNPNGTMVSLTVGYALRRR